MLKALLLTKQAVKKAQQKTPPAAFEHTEDEAVFASFWTFQSHLVGEENLKTSGEGMMDEEGNSWLIIYCPSRSAASGS